MSGRPYTPIIGSFESPPGSGDWEAIYDANANSSRLDSYHSLDLRIDRRFQFDRCNLIAYLDVSNVYNRQNIWSFEWLRKANEKKKRGILVGVSEYSRNIPSRYIYLNHDGHFVDKDNHYYWPIYETALRKVFHFSSLLDIRDDLLHGRVAS